MASDDALTIVQWVGILLLLLFPFLAPFPLNQAPSFTVFASVPCNGVLCPDEISVGGFVSLNLSDSYEELIDSWYKNGNVTRSLNGHLIVPWYDTSTSCQVDDLHDGGSCNIGVVNDSQYCMVTDELSQVGLILAMSDNQTRFEEFYKTVRAIQSDNGQLPGWRIAVNEVTGAIEPCRSGVNGNCDTASDATARIIIALLTASNNTLFDNTTAKNKYYNLSINLTDDMILYEFEQDTHATALGELDYWLKAGEQAFLTGTDGSYSGYYSDVMISLTQACIRTGNNLYCEVLNQTWHNYLVAANYTNLSITEFRVPPGRSFKWNFNDLAFAQCTNTCNPDTWEPADAPRAAAMCMSLYYAEQGNVSNYVPGLRDYCEVWVSEKATESDTSWVFQYRADGSNATAPQNSFQAQGWQAQLVAFNSSEKFNNSLRNALDHYNRDTETWDFTSCSGIYNQAFPMRALGFGIGRDYASFLPPSSSGGGDSSAPVLSSITTGSVSNSTVNVFWLSSELANSSVEYGITTSLGSSTGFDNLVSQHQVALSGLSAGTLYYYNVTSCDSAGNCASSGPRSFTTTSNPSVGNWSLSEHVYGVDNLTNNGAAYVGGSDAGYSFDGVNDFMEADGSASGRLDITGDRLSIVARYNTTTNPSVGGVNYKLVDKRFSGQGYYINQRQSDNTQHFAVEGASDTFYSPSNVELAIGSVQTVYWVYDGSDMIGYLDGVFQGSDDSTGNIAASSKDLFLGSAGGSNEFYDGTLLDVKIFNTSLSQQQITVLQNGGDVACDSLVGWYAFESERQSCNECPDLSSVSGLNVTITDASCMYGDSNYVLDAHNFKSIRSTVGFKNANVTI